ncbi:MAG TPA: branched-chain amino acid ABC transporter substrate-binding protein [Solirubrobacteraceae bacterium]|nr:branched-chain amino acid ABC transporter substrate-binding protein [Solirubrobacteraceae bacterium]
MRARAALISIAALALAGSLAGCGGGAKSGGRISGRGLTIYASLPEQGQWSSQALAVMRGAELALAQVHGAVGKDRITYVVLDDSTAKAGTWVPGFVASNAQQAAADRTTIGYLGEFNPDASAISIPVLNRAGIPQISPADGAAGLTMETPGNFPGEPEKYYPTGTRTFARVVPNDGVEAAAQAELELSLGCTKTYVLDDGTVYGADLANTFAHDAQAAGLTLAGTQGYDPSATSYGALAAAVTATGADCVFLSAIAESGAAAVTTALGAALPEAKIFAPDGVANGAYLDAGAAGIPFSLDHRVYITMAPLEQSAYPPASHAFFDAYERRYGPVEPYAIYGYAAMTLMLRAIDRATDHGRRPADRTKVLAAIFATRNRQSVLGTYSINHRGDATLRAYGAYRVVRGRLVFLRTLQG